MSRFPPPAEKKKISVHHHHKSALYQKYFIKRPLDHSSQILAFKLMTAGDKFSTNIKKMDFREAFALNAMPGDSRVGMKPDGVRQYHKASVPS